MTMLIEFEGKKPQIGKDVFIAPTAVLIGDVVVGDGSSIWFGAVLRGDFGKITIGPGCSVQDNVVLHVFDTSPTTLEENVVVGHGSVLEGCAIGAGTVIGMNAVVLPHARVGKQVMIAAGSVVKEGDQIPDRVLAAGAPAQVKKKLSDRALKWVGRAAADYQQLQARYRAQ
ncbi:MAG: gamma carbonic anhydrase family protein, partial [Chloroflexi bacterium]|nr:gamma carbonic anhydrase family protein [Chloroflexota bacterium]